MVVKWKPAWYELDQTVIAGDIDVFYLTREGCFANGLYSLESRDIPVRAKILRITHPQLGKANGIMAEGLDYTVYLAGGEKIAVNAEENPGEIYDGRYSVTDWEFDVEIEILEKLKTPPPRRTREQMQQRLEKYKILLSVADLKNELV